jgi:hypothetical protein
MDLNLNIQIRSKVTRQKQRSEEPTEKTPSTATMKGEDLDLPSS